MERYLAPYIKSDLRKKIVLLSGPRQVGKTTLSKQLETSFFYLNYDSAKDRRILMAEEWDRGVALVIFDEIHKMKKWKSWIKGIYDTEGVLPALLVTGSASLDTYKKGGDSLAGRHFSYRLHPLTLKELGDRFGSSEHTLERLMKLGGFPEPFLNGDEEAARRWRRGHLDTVLRQDLLDLEKVRDIKSIEIMVELLRTRVGSTVSLTSLANDLQVSAHTVKHWLQILENLYVIFPVRPYHKNVARSLLKDSKYYFYDTGAVEGDDGAKLENAVACALLRETHLIEDTKGYRAALCFMKDKDGREVDFLTVVDSKPRQLIEVKWASEEFSKNIWHFQRFVPTASCFQLVHRCKRGKTSDGVQLMPAHRFLSEISLS